ncbi:MAG: hypothetical protein LBS65_05050 [Desulfovibrio sp.]|jgi:hypothetical protein|nr:hypothetical protein [Desulfovibrio sp.]
MQNHYYDNTHPLRPYTHSLTATPGTMPPVNALRGDKPTATAEGRWPAEKNGAWIEIEDYRGKSGYLNGKPHIIKEYGPYPDGWSDTPPDPTPAELTKQRRTEILARLAEIDDTSVRPLRAIAQGEAVQADHDKLAALDAEAAELRTELAGFYDTRIEK